MLNYIIRRLLILPVILIGVTMLVFVMLSMLTPYERASLIDDSLDLSSGDVLILEEIASPATGAAADADPAHRHAIRITSLESVTDPVLDVDVVNISWADEDALPFALCLSARVEGDLLHV